MDIDQFWSIVEEIKDEQNPVDSLAERLEQLTPQEIISFNEHLYDLHDKAFIWDLWGAAYIIQGGCSDDGFMDFRFGLISRGKEVFERTIENPDSLADLDDCISYEEFGTAAIEAYEVVVGDEIPSIRHIYATEPSGERWDFDNLDECSKRLPRLYERYLYDPRHQDK